MSRSLLQIQVKINHAAGTCQTNDKRVGTSALGEVMSKGHCVLILEPGIFTGVLLEMLFCKPLDILTASRKGQKPKFLEYCFWINFEFHLTL